MVFGQLTVALRSGGTMSPLPVSAFRIEHIVTVQPDEGLRIGVEGIPQRFVIHYFNIINTLTSSYVEPALFVPYCLNFWAYVAPF